MRFTMVKWFLTYLNFILDNLHYLIQEIPFIDEVSIGHALVCDSLYLGLENTIQLYRRQLNH